MDAVGDSEFDNNEPDENYTTLRDDSWKLREKMYTIQKREQTLLVNFRSLNSSQKETIEDMILKMKKENAED